MVDVSIIIVNYNTAKLTSNCIHSILKQTKDVEFEIIVIDNNSSDNSIDFLRSVHDNINLISLDRNVGFGPANNLASKNANGKYLFFLNSDTIFLENSLKILLNTIKNLDLNSQIIGCNLINKSLKNDFSFGNFPTITQEIFEFGLKKIFGKYFDQRLSPSIKFGENEDTIKKVDYIVGADILIERTIFEKAKGFDDDFFLYYEETELFFRLKKMGYQAFCSPKTKIIHLGGQSSKTESNFNEWLFCQMHKSKWLYFKKCHGLFAEFLVKIIDLVKQPIIHRSEGVFKIYKLLISAL